MQSVRMGFSAISCAIERVQHNKK